MKTIILTSEYTAEIQKEVIKLLPAPANLMKVAFVVTARKPFFKKYPSFIHEDKNLMIEAGFMVEEYDLDGKTREEVRDDLMKFDIIYVAGGNTYYLLNAMHKVDFVQVIRELLDDGLIYIGESAGGIVAGPDIRVCEWVPKWKEGNEEVGLNDLNGLFLVDFGILPHFDGHLPEEVGKEVMRAPYDVKYLRDDQVILVRGKEVVSLEAK